MAIIVLAAATNAHFFMPAFSYILSDVNETTIRAVLRPNTVVWETLLRSIDTLLVITGALIYIGIAVHIRMLGKASQMRGKEKRILAQAVAITTGYLFFDLSWAATILLSGGPPPIPECKAMFSWMLLGVYLAVAGNGVIYMIFNKDLQRAIGIRQGEATSVAGTRVNPEIPTKKAAWVSSVNK